jgi:HNH endonuclease
MSISETVRERVRKTFNNCCGYCLSSQEYIPSPLTIDHIIPSARDGSDDEDNLCLACSLCNTYKGVQTHAIDPETKQKVRLFNPRTDVWADHFSWIDNGIRIVGVTPIGRATVIALQMNNDYAVTTRRWWVSAGWHPPT